MKLKRLFEIRVLGHFPDTMIVLADDESEARMLVPRPDLIDTVKAEPGYVMAVGPSRVIALQQTHTRTASSSPSACDGQDAVPPHSPISGGFGR
jgi:hypothetical protein